MDSYNNTQTANGESIAAIFSDRDSAHEALTELHHAGYRNVWVGVTRRDTLAGGEATIESDGGGGFMESLSRFFSGEENTGHSLHDALLRQGISSDLVRQTEAGIAPGSAVVTVNGENDPEEAISIIEQYGGRLVGGARAYGASKLGTSGIGTTGVAATGVATTAAAATADINGDRPLADREKLDEARRLQLREERLSVDKQRVSAGEARIGKDVVTEQQSIDVPVFREELYVERRPVSGTAAASTTPIGEGEEIVVPLTKEQVDVQKRTVVTEEVAVGKRRIEDTEHVSDTVRREELRVDDRKGVNTATLDDPATRTETVKRDL